MKRRALVSGVGSLLLAVAAARADISPPPRAKITLELTVEGQASLPQLKLLVTNCNDEPEKAVLDPNEPLVCNPERGPVRVFGFRESDLIELFSKIRSDAGREESAKFLAAKAKTCGEVSDRDLNIRDVNVSLVQARYSVEKRDKDSCLLKRVSATNKTKSDLQGGSRPAPSPSPASATPASSPPPAPSPSSEISGGRGSSCNCDLAASASGGPGAAVLLLLLGLARATRARGRRRTG